MPGILPMKVIKVGSSSQSRIAQACDRCRSKKIRCDGTRPTCSQCANVGFECRTSDKLSRRAFPRGYTESLEERVRLLESEVRDLKDLLDEKDETIDMLSKMHGNQRRLSVGSAASVPVEVKEVTPSKEDTFRVQASPLLLGVENSDSYFMGASSGRAFIEAFKRKMQERGKACSDFNTEAFLHIQGCYPLVGNPGSLTIQIPPRLFMDRCVNVFIQEWAPLFPVLHKPTFLQQYEEFAANPDKIKDNHKLAQLYLVFCTAALSSDRPDLEQIAVCEQQWQHALQAIMMENTMATLQCLVLALMYCAIRADYKRLQHYKAVAVGLSHRLGLHQSQKRFSFGALTTETRKKVFWTLYTLDAFSAATLGLPKLLKEEDVYAEFPSDIDDEYVTEKGFQPTTPGEHTRLSSALALFRGSRILAKVLEKNYPAATTHELSLQQTAVLNAELDEWNDSLPPHLRLGFRQDKPSTDVTGSRSPILSLVFYYTKTLIHRPAVGSTLGSKAAPALVSIADSSKRMMQIIELLEERSMAFALCANKSDLIMLCGITLLYQTLDLKRDSKLLKDIERFINSVIARGEQVKAPGIYELKKVAATLAVSVQDVAPASLPTPPRQSPEIAHLPSTSQREAPAPQMIRKQSGGSIGRHISATVSETDLLAQQEKLRRMTMPAAAMADRHGLHRTPSRSSFDNARTEASALKREHQHQTMSHAPMIARLSTAPRSNNTQSLDFLSFNQAQQHANISSSTTAHIHSTSHTRPTTLYTPTTEKSFPGPTSTSEWDAVLNQFDTSHINFYDPLYNTNAHSHSHPALETPLSASSSSYSDWSPSMDIPGFDINDFGTTGLDNVSSSALSLSEDNLSSGPEDGGDLSISVGELDFSTTAHGGGNGRQQTMIAGDGFVLEGLDGGFGFKIE